MPPVDPPSPRLSTGNGNSNTPHVDASVNTVHVDVSSNTVNVNASSNSVNVDVSSNTVHVDVSSNTIRLDVSYNIHTDLSNSIFDLSCDDTIPVIVPIVRDISYTIVDGSGYEIITKTGKAADGTQMTRVTFDTTQPDLYDPNIHENLTTAISTYDDESAPGSQTEVLLNQIRGYATQLQCTDFQGKGSIDDYTTLFQAASKIATESKQMELDVDIEGFNEFASAADDLSALFNGFITKLQNVNIITDVTFLTSISIALQKIVNLSNVFGKFKETVFATSTVQLPKSAHDAAIVVQDVMDEVNCAMEYIQYFVDPTSKPALASAQLSSTEKNIITKAVATIDSWNVLCDQGISIAMANDPDVKFIQQSSTELKTTTRTLVSLTNNLKSKLASLHILC
jgi:hypothetical protein